MSEHTPSDDAFAQILRRLDWLEAAYHAQTRRLAQVEQQLGLSPTPSPNPAPNSEEGSTGQPSPARASTPQPVLPPRPSPPVSSAPQTPPVERGARAAAAGEEGKEGRRGAKGAGTSSVSASSSASATPKKLFDFETLVGGSWFLWIGIIAVTFGVAFFLKWAFESQWIGHGGRVTLGAVAGLGLLIFGERLRLRGLRQYAYVLSGGGILILYLSVYAAYGFYQLINQAPAFLLMTGVTSVAVLLSARLHALPIAITGLVGGFLTPILLSTGRDNEVGLFSYIALLDAGVLTLAYLKRWRSLYHMSFVATLLMFTGWATIHYTEEKLWPTLFFLSLFFLLFSLLAILHNVLPRRLAEWFDITLIIANASFFFSMSYGLLDEAGYHALLGSFALVVSAFYLLLFYLTWSRHRADRLLTYSLFGAAITFFTMAVAIQLEQQWVTIAWAVESVVLVWVGLRAEAKAPRHAALVVFMVACAHWLTVDLFEFAFRFDRADAFTPLLNARAAACAALVGSCAGIVRLYHHAPAERAPAEERSLMTTAFTLAGTLLAFTLLTLDVNDYFEKRRALASAGVSGLDGMESASLENTRQLSLTALWALYGAAALVVGILRRLFPLRLVALALLLFTACKVLAVDLDFASAPWHMMLFNPTFAAFSLVVISLGLASYFYARAGAAEDLTEREKALPTLVIAANLLALVALSAEASSYFGRQLGAENLSEGRWQDLRLAQQLSLSVIWMLYGAGLLLFGRLRHNRLLRVMALLLLVVTTAKVFFWDLSSLERVYRIISFIVLGLVLLAISYLYQRSQQGEAEAARAEAAPAEADHLGAEGSAAP